MKKVPILSAMALLFVFVLILAACNSSTSGGGFSNVDVKYTVTGDTINHNANQSVDFRDPLAGTDFRFLTWFCGNFEGDRNKQIKLTFKKQNNTWVLDKKEVNGGSCG
jgi:hypothetical protein